MFLNYSATTETLRTQTLPKKLSDCLNSLFNCPIDPLCFTSTYCKCTRVRCVVTVYQKVDKLRRCIKACQWIYNWTSSVMLFTRLLFTMVRYTRCIFIETASPKTVMDMGNKQVRNALVSGFLLQFVHHKAALLVCSLFAGGRWRKKLFPQFLRKLRCFYWRKSLSELRKKNNDTSISSANTIYLQLKLKTNCNGLTLESFFICFTKSKGLLFFSFTD